MTNPENSSEASSSERFSGASLANELSHPANPEGGGEPEFKFVFWQHTKENIEASVRELEDCDVVVLEGADLSGEQIESINQNLADISEGKINLKHYLKYARKTFAPEIAQQLDLLLPYKRLIIADAPSDDPKREKLTDEWEATRTDYHEGLYELTTAESRANLLRFAHAYAQESTMREDVLLDTLANMNNTLPQGYGKVGVLYGSYHTRAYLQAHSQGMSVSRVFVPEGKSSHTYSHFSELERQLALQPERPVDEDLLNRCLLADFMPQQTSVEKCREVLDKLEHSSLVEALAHIDAILLGHEGAKSEKRRERLVDKYMAQVFAHEAM